MQTRRHVPYGSLQPIQSPPVLFFTYILEFILAFSLSKEGFNVLMLVISKFFKRVILIEGKDTRTAKDWAHTFLNKLDYVNWGLRRQLITEQDLKFFSKFLTTFFEKLGIKLFYSTAYHLQTNGSSEKTN